MNDRFALTGGLRVDIPIITSDPKLDTYLRDSARAIIAGYYSDVKMLR